MARRTDKDNSDTGKAADMKPCSRIEAVKNFEKHYHHIMLNRGMVRVLDVRNFAESAKRAVELLRQELQGRRKKKPLMEQCEITMSDKTVMNVTCQPGTTPLQIVNQLVSLAAMISVENSIPPDETVAFMVEQFEDIVLCRG